MDEKFKTHISDISAMKPSSVRIHGTVATIKYMMNKYDMSKYERIETLFELIQLECDEMDSKIGTFEIRK